MPQIAGQTFQLLLDRFQAVERRLDQQDKVLGEIHRETKRTNGRVNGHDTRLDAIDGRLDDEVDERKTRWTDRRQRIEFVIGSGCVLLGGCLGDLLHHWGIL